MRSSHRPHVEPLFVASSLRRGDRGRGKVVIVDDEPSICRMLTLALDRGGFAALAVISPWQGLALLEQESPDAVIVDLCMPDMAGDVFFRRAVSRQPWLRHRALFITGDVSPEAIDRVQRTGCPYLLKPFDLDTAVHAVVALLPEGIAPLTTPVHVEAIEEEESRTDDRGPSAP